MPRLRYSYVTKGQAIACLISVYRKDSAFMKELRRLRQPYLQALSELAAAWLMFGAQCSRVLPPEEFHKFCTSYFLKGDKRSIVLPQPLADYLSCAEQKQYELQLYIDSLAKLAHKWKLEAPWAVPMLLLFDIAEIWHDLGIPEEV